ncbi:Zinc finger protein basonuclin-2 [Microtus ochrogaster]|uniref:Zinc finger protein basonuclin-2 n=3 Tax=Boreoeutheria TaxID=1437010 RepID=A0A8J6L2G3_MICOH|nr:Zinc finger protein basonuclin-2 [Microtus ochrogaster]
MKEATVVTIAASSESLGGRQAGLGTFHSYCMDSLGPSGKLNAHDANSWARFVPSPPPNCLSYKAEGRLADQDWQAHFKVPCCGVDPSQLESEEAEVDVRERDTQRDREPKRARDLTLRDSCPDNSMQFGTRTTAAEPGFMGTWQNADTNLLFRMSQQAIRCTLVNCTCECFQPGKINLRTCDQCKHGWVAHALDKLSTQHLYHPTQVEIVQSNVVFDISSLMLYGTQAVPVRLKILLDRLFSVLKQEEVLHILHGLGWTLRDYVRGYILQLGVLSLVGEPAIVKPQQYITEVKSGLLTGVALLKKVNSSTETSVATADRWTETQWHCRQVDRDSVGTADRWTETQWALQTDVIGALLVNASQITKPRVSVGKDAAGKVLDRWAIMSREEEIITLQQFLRFGETKSIVELMAIQEKEGQAVAVPSSKTDSDIRTFIESNNRTRSPSLLAHLENSNPSSIHHFENIPNSLAFLLPFQYINPVSAPLLGLPPNGLLLEQPGLRLREPSISTQNEYNESSESEVSPTPYKSDQTPNRNALTSITNVEPKTEPACVSPIQNSAPVSDLSKTEHPKSSFRIHRMRRMGSASRKGRVFCNACGKTFYDKGTLKIHYNAVHLKIKHRCTIEGCNMVFSSLRSRNRHSANPNPRLHMPMLRNNRDKDLIRATSGAATPVIASTKSNLTLTSPGRPPMGFTTPPLDPVLQNPLPSQLVFSGLKTVQPVPPFYRSLLTPGEMVSPPTSLPTSPIIPTSGPIEQHPPPPSEPIVPAVMMGTHEPSADLAPKKKPRKSSMPVKIEKEIIDTADEFDDEDDDPNDGGTVVNDMSHDNHCHSQEEMSPGMSVKDFSKHSRTRCISRTEIRRADSMTSEDQEPERDYENESESSEPKLGEESMEGDEHIHSEVSEKVLMNSERPDENHSEPSHQDVIKVKEEFTDPTYDMFYMSQYGLYNGGGASMAALHESFASSLNYGSPQKFSPEGDLCSSPDPKICYVCKKSFKSSYSVKLHYRNVHLKEMHVCTVAGCNAAFPSRRSRDRHSANINLHRKLLTKELDDMGLDSSQPSLSKDLRDEFLMKIYGAQHPLGLDVREDASSPAGTEDSHLNGYGRGMAEDYMVLDLSTTSSLQSSSSIHSSRESDAGSDEGILLDDIDGASDSGESAHKAEAPTLPGSLGAEVSGSLMFSSLSGSNGGIMCNICHKMYSNKGTLRVHYKTVHLREMHKCKVPGCNMMFSSVRSRNRHSQNPNLHKNIPFTSID